MHFWQFFELYAKRIALASVGTVALALLWQRLRLAQADQLIRHAEFLREHGLARLMEDTEFKGQLEIAIQDLPEDEVARVVHLSPEQLREWVKAPQRMRQHVLAKYLDPKVDYRQSLARIQSQWDAATLRLKAYNDDFERKHFGPGGSVTRLRNLTLTLFVVVFTLFTYMLLL